MSLPGPRPRPPSATALTVVMALAGVLLLLPGLCAIFFAGSMVVSDGLAVFRDIGNDPMMVLILVLWIVCFVALLLGVWLLRGAWRRRRP